jgi:hypothetical protein
MASGEVGMLASPCFTRFGDILGGKDGELTGVA